MTFAKMRRVQWASLAIPPVASPAPCSFQKINPSKLHWVTSTVCTGFQGTLLAKDSMFPAITSLSRTHRKGDVPRNLLREVLQLKVTLQSSYDQGPLPELRFRLTSFLRDKLPRVSVFRLAKFS